MATAAPHPEIDVESGEVNSAIASSTDTFPELPISIAMSNSLPDEPTEGNTAANLAAEGISEISTISNTSETAQVRETEPINVPVVVNTPIPSNVKTQLQQFSASLLHVQTNLAIEIPSHLPVVHIGKPNTVIPPDIDVSGFPDSDIVSRIHADIRAEGGAFYFEDTGSSNGTYVNNLPLSAGNRHKLRAGDRISLGKGDKVSFVFQLSS